MKNEVSVFIFAYKMCVQEQVVSVPPKATNLNNNMKVCEFFWIEYDPPPPLPHL